MPVVLTLWIEKHLYSPRFLWVSFLKPLWTALRVSSTADLLPLSPPSTICTRASGQTDCCLKSDHSHSPFRSHTSFSIKRAAPPNCKHSVLLITHQLLLGEVEVHYGDIEAGERALFLWFITLWIYPMYNCKFFKGWGSYLILSIWPLTQCLTQGRYFVNACWIDVLRNVSGNLLYQGFSSRLLGYLFN